MDLSWHHDKESHVGMHSRRGCCLHCLSCRCSFLFPRSLHHRSGQLPFLVCLMRLHNMVRLVLLRNLAIPRALGISSLQNWAMLPRSYRGATAKPMSFTFGMSLLYRSLRFCTCWGIGIVLRAWDGFGWRCKAQTKLQHGIQHVTA